MAPPQQPDAQPLPPHLVHDAGQQTAPDDDSVPSAHIGSASAGDGVGVTGSSSIAVALRTHGAGLFAHDRPASRIAPLQHELAPPGRSEQPLPPHFDPQSAEQHTSPLPLRMPYAQFGSDVVVGNGTVGVEQQSRTHV
jgi:hypothetical protein